MLDIFWGVALKRKVKANFSAEFFGLHSTHKLWTYVGTYLVPSFNHPGTGRIHPPREKLIPQPWTSWILKLFFYRRSANQPGQPFKWYFSSRVQSRISTKIKQHGHICPMKATCCAALCCCCKNLPGNGMFSKKKCSAKTHKRRALDLGPRTWPMASKAPSTHSSTTHSPRLGQEILPWFLRLVCNHQRTWKSTWGGPKLPHEASRKTRNLLETLKVGYIDQERSVFWMISRIQSWHQKVKKLSLRHLKRKWAGCWLVPLRNWLPSSSFQMEDTWEVIHRSIFFLRQPAPKTAFLSTIQTLRWIGYPSFGFILKNIQILYHRLCPSPCRAPSCNIVETTARRSIAPRPERRASNVHRSGYESKPQTIQERIGWINQGSIKVFYICWKKNIYIESSQVDWELNMMGEMYCFELLRHLILQNISPFCFCVSTSSFNTSCLFFCWPKQLRLPNRWIFDQDTILDVVRIDSNAPNALIVSWK